MPNPSVLQRCTVQKPNGSFCDVRSLVDSPFPICRGHAELIYRHYDAEAEAKTAGIVHALRGSLENRSMPDISGYEERVERRERRRLLAHIDAILAEHGDPVFTTYIPASV